MAANSAVEEDKHILQTLTRTFSSLQCFHFHATENRRQNLWSLATK